MATLPKWGEYFTVFFQIWIESFGEQNWYEIVRFTSTENNSGSPGDRIPAIFLNSEWEMIWVASQVGENANYDTNINIQSNAWVKVEIKQHPVNGEVMPLYHGW